MKSGRCSTAQSRDSVVVRAESWKRGNTFAASREYDLWVAARSAQSWPMHRRCHAGLVDQPLIWSATPSGVPMTAKPDAFMSSASSWESSVSGEEGGQRLK